MIMRYKNDKILNFILRYKVFFIILFSLLLIKVIWVAWSCWNLDSFEGEKNDLLQRKNHLVGKIVVEPRQLLNEMPGSIGLQFQGEWALYSCSMLTEALSNMAELYPETKNEAVALIDSLIQIVKSPELLSTQRYCIGWRGYHFSNADQLQERQYLIS